MSAIRSILGLAAWIALCAAAAMLGSVFTSMSLESWYPGLRKPSFNPPNWVFGPVWTVLYLLMAVAAWRVWRKSAFSRGRLALTLFLLQLSLNVTWSLLFFGLRRPDAAFVEIIVLWLAILAATAAFARHDRPAAAMMTPYLLWVAFAAVLNLALWRLNA